MKFSSPDMLFLLWIVVIAAGLIIYGIKKQHKILSQFASRAALDSILPQLSSKRKWIKGCLLIFALVFLCIAISGPLVGYKWEKIEQKGVDIMIALDCSRSMLCQDIKPSRLQRAKREIIDLLRIMKSDRAGLVAFSGKAFLQCPLTLDHNAFNIFLDVLEPDYLPVGGTDIGGAILTCLKSFETDINSGKAIIIITDGENTAQNSAKDAVKKAAEAGVKIFCIGMGSKDGAPVPDKNGGFQKNSSNNMIISKVDEKGLRQLAALGSGQYVRSVTGDMDLHEIYTRGIRQNMEKKTLKSFRQKVWENRYQWLLLPCIILLFAELIISRQKTIKNLMIIFTALVAFTLFDVPTCYAGAGIRVGADVKQGIKAFEEQDFNKAEKKFIDAQLKDPDNIHHYYNIGAAAYKNQKYDDALRNFKTVLQSKDNKENQELKHKALYNIGNTQYRRGNLEEAVKKFTKVLKDYPSDKLARENLEFVKKKIEEQKKQDKQKKQKDNKNNKDKKEDQKKEKQEKQDQDQKRDKDQQKDKNQDKDQKKNQDKKQNDKKDDKKQNRKQDGDKNKDKDKQPQKEQQQSIEQKEKEEKGKPDKQQMLNRLSDKPGKAMMQSYKQQKVEKDW